MVSAVQRNTPREDGNIASTATSATKTRSTGISKPGPSSMSALSTSGIRQKNPHIASRTVDLTNHDEDQEIIVRISPRFTPLLLIDSPVDLSTSNLDTFEVLEEYEENTGVVKRKRLWNSEMAKQNHKKSKIESNSKLKNLENSKLFIHSGLRIWKRAKDD